jgi:hypothetical protein
MLSWIRSCIVFLAMVATTVKLAMDSAAPSMNSVAGNTPDIHFLTMVATIMFAIQVDHKP